jgi:spermidine synthase
VLLALFFASGAAALIYQVLWLKELGLLFGVTAYAAATTLAVFFLGLGAGSLVWGQRSACLENPLRVYGLLEVGIAATAILYFGILDLYSWLYPVLFQAFGSRPAQFLAVKFLLGVGVLLPPAFLMGGTLPVLAQLLVRRADELGRTATFLYAVNTLGAAVGAVVAGFFLPRAIGFQQSYLVAMGISLLVGVIALWMSRSERSDAEAATDRDATRKRTATPAIGSHLIWALAFMSGLLTLALEVLWTRMFAQVLQNSVYTFAAILTVFLVALGLGSVVAHWLCRRRLEPRAVLFCQLAASGLAVGLTPVIFHRLNPGLSLLGADLGWNDYVAAVFGGTAAVLLLPGIVIGSVYPYLMKVAEGWQTSAGSVVGRLGAINTVAAILGSLVAGFLLLDYLGLWSSIGLVSVTYYLLSLAVIPNGRRSKIVGAAIALVGLTLQGGFVWAGGFRDVAVDTLQDEELVEVREGAHGTVAVIRRGDDIRLKVNNSYLLGTSRSTPNLRLQSWIPLSLHPDPRSVFFLGMGTGITAGGALQLPVERVVVTELNPHVIAAARDHFTPYLNGLFEDPRATVIAEDGRTYLAGTRESFDVVIADIFLTHRAGVGSLYTREHFETVRNRLRPGGLFAQWLPMFELTEEEFGIIARTMLEVFPQLTVWRRGFSPRYPLAVLVGRTEKTPLDLPTLSAHLASLSAHDQALPPETWIFQIPLAAYMGNLSEMADKLSGFQVSTDDRIPLEYLAPRVERNRRGSKVLPSLAWLQLVDFSEDLLRRVPPESDPFLALIEQHDLKQVPAGLEYQRYLILNRLEQREQAEAALKGYQSLIAESGQD